jgi:hypothetical protein
VRLETAEVTDGSRKACAFRKVASRVPVPLHSIFFQCKIDHRTKEHSRRERVFGRERVRCWRQNFVVIAVQLTGTLKHEGSGLIQRWPGHQECQCLMYHWKSKGVGHGALFCLNVIEIRQSLEIGAQMGAVERPLKALPTERLCLVFASQRFHHIEAYLLPFERDPTAAIFIDGIDSAPGLLSAARPQKSPSDFSRNSWDGSGLSL